MKTLEKRRVFTTGMQKLRSSGLEQCGAVSRRQIAYYVVFEFKGYEDW